MRIDRLYRYPVKGLTAEALEAVPVAAGGALPWDRAFALVRDDDGGAGSILDLGTEARLARLRASFDARAGHLALRADGMAIDEYALDAEGQARLGAWLSARLGTMVRLVRRPDPAFGAPEPRTVSLIGLASLADYEARLGARRHKRRFRANIWFSGAPAWGEFDWIGRELQVGGARLGVVGRIAHGATSEVNPETGERNADPADELRRLYGHPDLGVTAEILDGGAIAMGDAIQLLPG
jgi:uncharacterized protein YcbX